MALKLGRAGYYLKNRSFVVRLLDRESDTAMPAISVQDLHQQIAERERELKALREELESRKDHVAALIRRKEELRNQLRQVEKELAALSAGAPAATEQPKPAAPSAPTPGTPAKDRPKLGEMIVVMLREAGKPMTARQLSEEAHRRGFQSASNDPVKPFEARLQELKKKGTVRRAPGQPGYVLATSTIGASATKPKRAQPAQKEQRNAAVKPGKPQSDAKPSQPVERQKTPPLREAILNVLKSSRKPLSGTELADRVLKSGYKTTSTKFRDVVWSMLGQMDEVQHVRGKGYQLKRKA
jgi:hypothetical protein